MDRQVVEVMEFDTTHPDMQGWMTPTVELSDEPGGVTWLVALHEDLPPGVVPKTTRLAKLAALVAAG